MTDFLAAVGLMLVLEGAMWSLFPDAMKRAAAATLAADAGLLRVAGLSLAVTGVVAVWLVRG